MKPGDLWQLSTENLWRTKLRSGLTALGVIIGIGALVSMVSFGIGMQHNVTKEFHENDLFTSMQVLPARLDMNELMSGELEPEAPTRALNDSAVAEIAAMPGVQIAFPEISFPVMLRYRGHETRVTLQAVPAAMGRHKPLSEIEHGGFFESDDEASVVLTWRALSGLEIRLKEQEEVDPRESTGGGEDSLAVVPADSLIGARVEVASAVLDVDGIARSFMQSLRPSANVPVREETVRLTVVGIRDRQGGFGGSRFGSGIIVPIETAAGIPRLGFSDVMDLLDRSGDDEGYASVYVRTADMSDVTPVREAVEEMGFGVIAVVDQLEEVKQAFLIMDALLGTVGTIALIVAALGIVNTMVTSILERTREIGVMKAIGGSESDIRWIFFTEAGTIGLVGGAGGLMLGWAVTRVANAVANHFLRPQGVPSVDLFYMPFWLILGALGFAVGVSLLAGLYPASRAARVDPVQALRHD